MISRAPEGAHLHRSCPLPSLQVSSKSWRLKLPCGSLGAGFPPYDGSFLPDLDSFAQSDALAESSQNRLPSSDSHAWSLSSLPCSGRVQRQTPKPAVAQRSVKNIKAGLSGPALGAPPALPPGREEESTLQQGFRQYVPGDFRPGSTSA